MSDSERSGVKGREGGGGVGRTSRKGRRGGNRTGTGERGGGGRRTWGREADDRGEGTDLAAEFVGSGGGRWGEADVDSAVFWAGADGGDYS